MNRLAWARAIQRVQWWATAAGRIRLGVVALVAGAALVGFAGVAHADAPPCDTDASCAALGVGTGYGVTDEKVATYGPVLVAEATSSPAVWECLRGLGYVGDPSDGVEALYAPASDVAECTSSIR